MAKFIGIDVGGLRKGFHCVLLDCDDATYVARTHLTSAIEVANWCFKHAPRIVAIDAPCKWSQSGKSRAAERALHGVGIHCFFTPSDAIRRQAHKANWNYDWIVNARKLYEGIESRFPLYNGVHRNAGLCIETFPNAVAHQLYDGEVPAGTKNAVRRALLDPIGMTREHLPNIDFVDAALCALAARSFSMAEYAEFGDISEGFIVVPTLGARVVGIR